MVVNVGQCTLHGSYVVYVDCGPLPVTKVYEGLVRDPHIENAIILVVTGILGGHHTQCILVSPM